MPKVVAFYRKAGGRLAFCHKGNTFRAKGRCFLPKSRHLVEASMLSCPGGLPKSEGGGIAPNAPAMFIQLPRPRCLVLVWTKQLNMALVPYNNAMALHKWTT